MTIQDILDLTNYDTGERLKRRKTQEVNSQEFFTPFEIVENMCNKIPEEDWQDKDKTFLEPCFGNGQFVLYIIWKRLHSGVSLVDTLKTLYGIELMEDNVEETKERIFNLIDKLQLQYNKEEVRKILDNNLVCHDFFTWNFLEWREYNEEELKELNKKKK